MGAVLRAFDPDLGRDLAVKVLREEFRGRADLERRFLEEARITGRLQHPGTVSAVEVGRPDDERLRSIAVWKMEGYTNGEIAIQKSAIEPIG